MRVSLSDYVLDVDVEKTRSTYCMINKGGAESCGCSYCRNYLSALPNALPKEILQFFAETGIDPRKDAEVYEHGEISPGVRSYGGEYCFWGSIVSEPKTERVLEQDFRLAFTAPSPLAQDEFRSEGALCLCLTGNIPWVLTDEEA
jgi:hypothetical protein